MILESLRRTVLTAFLTGLATAVATKIVEAAYDRWVKKSDDDEGGEQKVDAPKGG